MKLHFKIIFLSLLSLGLTIILAVIIALRFFKEDIIQFLSMNEPVNAEILIVEGWISGHSMDNAAREFKNNNYSKVISTGVGLEPWFLMPTSDFFEFSFPGDKSFLKKGDTVSIKLKGTQVNGIYPEYSLYLNDSIIKKGYTTGEWKTYHYITKRKIKDLKRLIVSFNNDYFEGDEDRNLYIGHLKINDTLISPRSENNFYYHEQNKSDIKSANYKSVADLAGQALLKRGIPENKIVILPAPYSRQNRTFSSALSVRHWFDSTGVDHPSVNIYSENIHARRTRLLYNYTLDPVTKEIGIISDTSGRGDSNQNIKVSNKNIVEEFAGWLYYKFFFNKKRNIGK